MLGRLTLSALLILGLRDLRLGVVSQLWDIASTALTYLDLVDNLSIDLVLPPYSMVLPQPSTFF